ncbi:MAG: riboflavin synthase [Pseudonocardiales bacterium]|nr:riboflavin synthase [Pseudonocardiales bacterium]
MFTGIVEAVGEVRSVATDAAVVRLEIVGSRVTYGTRHGESIAVNGVCLTAVDILGDSVSVELVPETLRRSSLAAVAAGTRVNLERALVSGQRFGGHIVQGHVDGVGMVVAHHRRERTAELVFELPPGLARYVVEKGSITVDGVSLTVASVAGDRFSVALIPTTLADTTLGDRQPGDQVNIEVDVLAKYVERLLAGYLPGQRDAEAAGYVGEGKAWS